MKMKCIQKLVGCGFVLAFAFLSFACQSSGNETAANQEAVKAATPREAYRMLYEAVKAKDAETVRQLMSNSTKAFAEFAAAKQNESPAEVVKNGLTATTFAASLPESRDERVNANFGALEVFNQKDNRWDDLPFVLEDGGWRLAVGDAFNGKFKSPGKGQAQLEMEASNPVNDASIPPAANTTETAPKRKGKKDHTRMIQVEPENANQQ